MLNRMEFKTCSHLDVIKTAAPTVPALVMGAALIGVLLCAGRGKDWRLCSKAAAVDKFIAIETSLTQPAALTGERRALRSEV